MQKLVWQNSNGDEINLTGGNYGITNWEGFSNTSLNIQSQQVPFQDGGVFLDALMEQRELSVTLKMQDNGNLETRYRMRRELIHALNPKLGEGYLIYTNDFISKRIKCVAQIPLFKTHNSNDSGTPEASLTWTASEPYWEDLEEKSVSLLAGERKVIYNEGDVDCGVKIDIKSTNATNPIIRNLTEGKVIKLNGVINTEIGIDTRTGQKSIKEKNLVLDYYNSSVTLNKIAISERLKKIVAVGDDGLILVSTDGVKWDGVTSGTTGRIKDIIYVDELQIFVAISIPIAINDSGVFASSDGINWTKKSESGGSEIVYSAELNMFVKAGDSGDDSKTKVYKSTDLENWDLVFESDSNTNYCNDIIYSEADHKFFSVGDNGLIASTDGINWSVENYIGKGIVYSEKVGKYVIVGNYGLIRTSVDGINWTIVEGIPTNIFFNSIIYNSIQGVFIAIGKYGKLYTSINGDIWSDNSIETDKDLQGIAYSVSVGLYVIVGTNGFIAYSGDSYNWSITGNLIEGYRSVYYSEERRLFIGLKENTIATSSDGITWIQRKVVDDEGAELNGLCYSEDKKLFVVVGGVSNSYAIVLTSDDGINWEQLTDVFVAGVQTSFYKVVYSEDKQLFVAVGEQGVYRSDNIKNWYYQIGNNVYDITYSKRLKRFVAVGGRNNAVIYYSDTGRRWYESSFDIVPNYEFTSVAYSDLSGIFIAVGNLINMYISYDGINWKQQNIENFNYVNYCDKMGFLLACGRKKILISVDGSSWKELNYNLNILINSIAFSDKYYAYGQQNLLLISKEEEGGSFINRLTSDSDMSLSLLQGQNDMLINRDNGDFYAVLSYRQKYIGV